MTLNYTKYRKDALAVVLECLRHYMEYIETGGVGDEWPTVGDLMDATRLSKKRIVQIVQSSDRFEVNVAIGCRDGVAKLSQKDWIIEFNWEE